MARCSQPGQHGHHQPTLTASDPGWLNTGQYTDTETGFIYLRARHYDPTTAQFTTQDPIVTVTREAYGYTGGNPTNASDPTGMFCVGSMCTEDLVDAAGAIGKEIRDGAGAVSERAGGAARTVGGRAVDVVVAGRNLPLTAGTAALNSWTGGDCDWGRSLTVVCYGGAVSNMDDRTFVVGSVINTQYGKAEYERIHDGGL